MKNNYGYKEKVYFPAEGGEKILKGSSGIDGYTLLSDDGQMMTSELILVEEKPKRKYVDEAFLDGIFVRAYTENEDTKNEENIIYIKMDPNDSGRKRKFEIHGGVGNHPMYIDIYQKKQ